MFLQIVSKFLPYYMVSHPRRQQSSCIIILTISSTNVLDVWSILVEQLSHAVYSLESLLVYLFL
jgi:hypothetical protein